MVGIGYISISLLHISSSPVSSVSKIIKRKEYPPRLSIDIVSINLAPRLIVFQGEGWERGGGNSGGGVMKVKRIVGC